MLTLYNNRFETENVHICFLDLYETQNIKHLALLNILSENLSLLMTGEKQPSIIYFTTINYIDLFLPILSIKFCFYIKVNDPFSKDMKQTNQQPNDRKQWNIPHYFR